MRFLIHGNAPHVRTGYGIQCAHLASRLKRAGHDVAVSVTYGVRFSIQNWQGVRLYPEGYEQHSNDSLPGHAAHWFADTPADECWIITLTDVWSIQTPGLDQVHVAAWVPVDHERVPPAVLEFFSRTQAVPIAMSKFGHDELHKAGLDPIHIPLSVDTTVYRPTATFTHEGADTSFRRFLDVDDGQFLVGMVGMNKGADKDRKGFNEAFWAFRQLLETDPDAVLYVHSERLGLTQGQPLEALRQYVGIPDENFRWAPQYPYRTGGFDHDYMAAMYTAFDVLLAPSHGEGFCVPMIEAQACGTPVIATNATAQRELIGPGWLVEGQPEYDPAQFAAYKTPYIGLIADALTEAHTERGTDKARGRSASAVEFAAGYDTEKVWEERWEPFLADIVPRETENALRDPIPDSAAVAVLCPLYQRTEHIRPLVGSFRAATKPEAATLYLIYDLDDLDVAAEVEKVRDIGPVRAVPATRGETFAQKINAGYQATGEPWLAVIGDDVRFQAGWLEAARARSDRFDVIGTNDTTGEPKNPRVASGAHADHFLIRRSYIETEGGSLEGPGVLAPEVYRHWYTDMEIVQLARARGVFTPCFESVIEHLHPGYVGDEKARRASSTYMAAVDAAEDDHATWMARMPLVEQQRLPA